jgi:hypothetical protein
MSEKPLIRMSAEQGWAQITARTDAAVADRDWAELALCVRQLRQHPDTGPVADQLIADHGEELSPYLR